MGLEEALHGKKLLEGTSSLSVFLKALPSLHGSLPASPGISALPNFPLCAASAFPRAKCSSLLRSGSSGQQSRWDLCDSQSPAWRESGETAGERAAGQGLAGKEGKGQPDVNRASCEIL